MQSLWQRPAAGCSPAAESLTLTRAAKALLHGRRTVFFSRTDCYKCPVQRCT